MAKRGRPPKNRNLQPQSNGVVGSLPINAPIKPPGKKRGPKPKVPRNYVPNPFGNGGAAQIYSDEDMLAAIINSNGRINKAADMLGCKPKTIHERAKVNPLIREEIKLRRRNICDKSEDVLAELLENSADENLRSKIGMFFLTHCSKPYKSEMVVNSNTTNTQINVTANTIKLEKILEDLPVEAMRQVLGVLRNNKENNTKQIELIQDVEILETTKDDNNE